MARPSPNLLQELWEKIQEHPDIEYEIHYTDVAIIYGVLLNLLYGEGWLKEYPRFTQTVLQWRREQEDWPPTQQELDNAFGGPSYPKGENRPPSMGSGFRDHYGYTTVTPLPRKKDEKKDTITTGELIQNEVRRLKTKGGPAIRPKDPEPLKPVTETVSEDEVDQKASIKRRKRGDGEW